MASKPDELNLPVVGDIIEPDVIPERDYDPISMTPEEIARANELAANLDPLNAVSILTFGAEAQRELTTYARGVLGRVKTVDLGTTGDLLTAVRKELQHVDVEGFSDRVGSVWAGLPVIGAFYARVENFLDKSKSVSDNLQIIAVELGESQVRLLNYDGVLEEFFLKNRDHRRELRVFIHACRQSRLKTIDKYNELVQQAKTSRDPEIAQQSSDYRAAIARLDNHLTNLLKSATISIELEPMLQNMRQNGELLYEEITSQIHFGIPLVEQTFAYVTVQYAQKAVLKQLRATRDMTDSVLVANAKLLEELTSQVSKEYGQGFVKLSTVKQVGQSVIASIKSANLAYENAAKALNEAEVELPKLVGAMSDALIDAQKSIDGGPNRKALLPGTK